MLGEYDGTGQPLAEYVWLGDLPVALRRYAGEPAQAELYAIETDHLGTPRVLTDASQRIRWRWHSSPFGDTAPDENPEGHGPLVFNLRFPGQYYDAESGLHYNYFRDYDPGTGRYVQSDPIGLAGGINTYGYARSNPLRWIDPTGLMEWKGGMSANAATPASVPRIPGLGFGGGVFNFSLTSKCVRGLKWRVYVVATAISASFGAPFSIVGQKVTFEDGLGDSTVQPYIFNGTFAYYGSGIAFGAGYGYTRIALGNAYSEGRGWYAGVDGGAAIATGYATVTNATPIECECDIE